MIAESDEPSQSSGNYRSGVAARLAGVPVETLRVWERRYSVVGPRLSPGRQRLYSGAEVRRLTLIKQLVDMGHPIGSIAHLQTDVLVGMRAAATALEQSRASAVDDGGARQFRTALVGPLLIAGRVAESSEGSAMQVVGCCPDVARASQVLLGVQADIVIIELPTIGEEAVALVAQVKQACGAATAIILYRYAPSALIRLLRTAGHAVARTSSDAAEIESICRNLLRVPKPRDRTVSERPVDSAPPPPKFDSQALLELARTSRTVYCECPKHLVELVVNLTSFERYSAECANRGPEDAELHRDLQRTAGYARAMIEEALLRVATFEGFPISNLLRANP